MTVKEIYQQLEEKHGKRTMTRITYAELITAAIANIAATDLREEIDRGNIVMWNIADDIARSMNTVERRYSDAMSKAEKQHYCSIISDFEAATERLFDNLRTACNNDVLYYFLQHMLYIDSVNANIEISGGLLGHKGAKDISKRVDKRYSDLFKQSKGVLQNKARIMYNSKEYKDIKRFLNSNWHMERIYHNKKYLK